MVNILCFVGWVLVGIIKFVRNEPISKFEYGIVWVCLLIFILENIVR